MDRGNGFTLIELTVVLAILAIIAAILIPTFLITTDRARLRGDIQSARIIQNAMELYQVERGQSVAGNTVGDKLKNLSDAGYLPQRNIIPQTQGAVWVYSSTHGVRVKITDSPEGVKKAFENLSAEERLYVEN